MRISDWSSDVCSSDLYNINIVGGSHPTRTDDCDIQNVAYVCLRDGSTHAREKIHPTPNERYWWNIKGGEEVDVIQTDCGPVGVLICYDSEFPELTRHLVDERSEEGRGGKECASSGGFRGSPYHEKTKR